MKAKALMALVPCMIERLDKLQSALEAVNEKY